MVGVIVTIKYQFSSSDLARSYFCGVSSGGLGVIGRKVEGTRGEARRVDAWRVSDPTGRPSE